MQRATRNARRIPRGTPLFEPLDRRVLMAATPTPIDIQGVYDASLDQPRTYALLRRSATGAPLTAIDPQFGTETFTIEAFYDTGASGVLLSKETADAMGIARATYNGDPVEYADVGVGGTDFFDVSEPLYTSLAPYGADRDLDNIDTFESVYSQKFGPLRMQISQNEADLEPLDVFGMPTMAGKVIVMDARPPSSETDLGLMRTYTYNPGTPYNASQDDVNPGIPRTNFHIALSYAHFDRFTDVTPAGAPGPTLRYNPFIGPNPIRQIDPSIPPDSTPGITITQGTKTFTGSWLFDTGAAASILSQHAAEAVGVRYAPGTYQSANPRLIDAQGHPIADQFTLDIGGIGGSFTAAGFFLDSLALPTTEGQPIRYLRAPVLVGDISVADPHTGQELTLDGVFGMNFLVASMQVDGANIGDTSAGAYDWLVFDEPHGVLGLNVPSIPTPTASVAGRHVFYNNSALDSADPAANAADDRAIAPDKQALLPGQRATFANYTGSANGITGLMFDVTGLVNADGVGADDVIVKTGNTATPATWALAPQPTVTVRKGAGDAGADRITLTWKDNQIRNEWVQVTIKADTDTGLSAPDVSYFGNLGGETGDSTSAAIVTAADLSRTRAKVGSIAPLESPFDHRHDRRINAADVAAVRSNMFQSLRLITAPAAATAALALNAANTDPANADAAATVSTRSAAPPRRRAWSDDQADVLGRVA